ncbi:hypothetical protein [Streptomyces triculaminicus]|uniref:hypothetical protein n=1 Tax=Streptomyces triculaminicus TaxID=2816232 RepID=UPI0037CF5AE9
MPLTAIIAFNATDEQVGVLRFLQLVPYLGLALLFGAAHSAACSRACCPAGSAPGGIDRGGDRLRRRADRACPVAGEPTTRTAAGTGRTRHGGSGRAGGRLTRRTSKNVEERRRTSKNVEERRRAPPQAVGPFDIVNATRPATTAGCIQ